MATPVQVVFDCADPDALATFWAAALNYQKQEPPEGYSSWQAFLAAQGIPEDQWNSASAVVDVDGTGPRIYFQQVPESKSGKNRVHLDLNVSKRREVGPEEGRKRVEAEVARLVAFGARQIRVGEQHNEFWIVMIDPEGNEFCVQ